MQKRRVQRRQLPPIFRRLEAAVPHFRHLRDELSHLFHKSQDPIEIIPSPFDLRPAFIIDRPPFIIHPDQYHSTALIPSEPQKTVPHRIAYAFSSRMDGVTERVFRRNSRLVASPSPANVSAIFVHAGAGYHSTTNENIHLSACNEYVDTFASFNWLSQKMKCKLTSIVLLEWQ